MVAISGGPMIREDALFQNRGWVAFFWRKRTRKHTPYPPDVADFKFSRGPCNKSDAGKVGDSGDCATTSTRWLRSAAPRSC
jgi:hypothetical protein